MGNSSTELQEIEAAETIDQVKTRDEAEDVKRVAPWTTQITFRGVIASIVIGIMYSVIVMKLNLTTGLVPNLNVSAALIAFVFIKTWTTLLGKAGIVSTPFTRQENTVIQTCAVACYSIAVGGPSPVCHPNVYHANFLLLCLIFQLLLSSRWLWILLVCFEQEDI